MIASALTHRTATPASAGAHREAVAVVRSLGCGCQECTATCSCDLKHGRRCLSGALRNDPCALKVTAAWRAGRERATADSVRVLGASNKSCCKLHLWPVPLTTASPQAAVDGGAFGRSVAQSLRAPRRRCCRAVVSSDAAISRQALHLPALWCPSLLRRPSASALLEAPTSTQAQAPRS